MISNSHITFSTHKTTTALSAKAQTQDNLPETCPCSGCRSSNFSQTTGDSQASYEEYISRLDECRRRCILRTREGAKRRQEEEKEESRRADADARLG
jgi:hypothetical protein